MKKEGHSCTHCGNEDIFFMGYCRDCTTKMMQKLGEITFPEKWEEEWEDEIWVLREGRCEELHLSDHPYGVLLSVFEKYILGDREDTKVTFKARKGAILIERIREVRNASENTGEASEGGPEDSLAPDE